MKRTLKRELKVPEIAKGEAVETGFWSTLWYIVSKVVDYRGRCSLVCGHAIIMLSALGWNTVNSCYMPMIYRLCLFWLARLETRTKEFSICASIKVSNLAAQWKWVSGSRKAALTTDWDPRVKGLSPSIYAETRKMVNYAWVGWSQGKLWWRLVAILTCKSFVKLGYRGERLIEPSSSWFPPKFPSG